MYAQCLAHRTFMTKKELEAGENSPLYCRVPVHRCDHSYMGAWVPYGPHKKYRHTHTHMVP